MSGVTAAADRDREAAAAREREAARECEAAAAREHDAEAAAAALERETLTTAADTATRAATDAQARVRAAAAALDREREAAAALERAAAEARDRLRDDHSIHDDASVHDDADRYEAALVANLHAQAAGVQNIRALVPVVLDLLSPQYNKWRDLMLLVCGRFSLSDHILRDATFPDVPSWHRMDCVVLSWIYGTISAELMEIVRARGTTARLAWVGIEQQFLGNRETRALHLDAEFRNLVQGDLSISDYCRKMKGMADALADLGKVIPDRTLVLNVLRGLNERFQYMSALLKRQRPFPTFIEVRSDLLLEELTMAPASSSTPSTALLAAKGTYAPQGISIWRELFSPTCWSAQPSVRPAGWLGLRTSPSPWERRQPLLRRVCSVAFVLQSLDRVHPDVARPRTSTFDGWPAAASPARAAAAAPRSAATSAASLPRTAPWSGCVGAIRHWSICTTLPASGRTAGWVCVRRTPAGAPASTYTTSFAMASVDWWLLGSAVPGKCVQHHDCHSTSLH